jgi:peptide/nickel transport system substrate-binding protein
MQGYWNDVLRRRISRRRALQVTGGGAAAAALLAACGGDGSDSETPKDTSGLLYQVKDETSNAKHGGRYVGAQTNALVTHDPHRIGAHVRIAGRGYSQMLRISDGRLENTDGTPEGDLASSWELSPDNLTLTMKIDPGAGFAPLPPVNGRRVDTDDVLFSWDRFNRLGTIRGDLANSSSSPDAPVLSVSAPDKETVIFKLKEPNATIFTLLSHSGLGSFWIVPREAADESQLDIARKPLGSGPYYVVESTEVQILYKKNPNFKRASLKNDEPYIEEVFDPVIVDIATLSSQFRTGAIHQTTIPALEVVGAKRENKDLIMWATDPPTTERVYFGQNPDSPFIDERMRKAYYKVIDRDAYVTAAYNVDRYEADGLPVTQMWEGSFAGASWEGWLLDPKSKKDYGDLQQSFVYDIAEAKRLVEAAGYKTPFDFDQVRSAPGPTSFARPIYDRMEIIEGMLDASGVFRKRFRDLEWATEWSPQIRQSKGKFSGTSWGPDTSSLDPSFSAFFLYHSGGGYFEGGDATLEQMAATIRREFDVERRKELVREIQRYDAGKMFNQKIGVAAGFQLAWPAVRNVNVYRGGTNWTDTFNGSGGSGLKGWLDQTKPPFRPA